MTLNGAVKIVLPRLKRVQQFINTKSSDSQILASMNDTLGKWVEEVGDNNLGLQESIEELKEVVNGIKPNLNHLVDEVGAKNKESVDELKGVVQKIQVENTSKGVVFGKLVQRLVKAVDGMKEKSSHMEKVNPPFLLVHKLY